MIWRSVLPPEMGMTVAPEGFSAVMSAQAAGEQAVAVGVLDNVTLVQTARGEAAQHGIGPVVEVLLGVGDDNGFAGGAAGGVQPHDFGERAGKEAKGISRAEVVFLGKGELSDIGKSAQVGGRYAAILHALPEESHVIISTLDNRLHALELNIAQLGQGQKVHGADGVETRRRQSM